MTRRLIPALLAAFLGLHASAARADSDDLSTLGPMTTLIVSGDSRVYALTSAGSLVWRSTASREWTRVLNPSGVTFSQETGLASAQPDPSWGYPRVYAVSLPNGSTPAQLYELDAEHNPNTWRPIGDASEVGQSLANTPSLAAVAVPGGPDPGVAAVLRLDNLHVVTCRYGHSGDLCSWEDETQYSAPLAESGSPVEAVYNKDTTHLDELWIVPETPHPVLELFDWWNFNGNELPTLADPWFVDTSGISGTSNVGDFRVLVTAWDNSSYGDELYVADSTDGGGSWVWTHLDPESGPTTPHGGVSWQRSSLDQAYSSSYFGSVYDAFFISAYQDEAWACEEPSTLSGGTVTCSGSDGNMPPDLKTARDNLGQSIVGTAYSSFLAGYYDAYVTGTLTDIGGTVNDMTYLYDMTNEPTMGQTWKNLLTARDVIYFDGLGGEFSGAAYYGDMAVIDSGGHLNRSFDGGSTWVDGPTQGVFPVNGGGDTSLAYDAHGTLYATTTYGNGQIVRALGSSGTWTAEAPIPPTQATLQLIQPDIGDRLWMAADKQRANFLYIMWHGHDGQGHISYCNGTAFCDNASAWCQDWSESDEVFHSGLHCGSKRNPACLVEAGGDHVWVLVPDDPACDPKPSPYDQNCGSTWTCGRDVALREIDNRADLGPIGGGKCVTPSLALRGCLYFQDVATALDPNSTPESTQLHPETDDPPPCYTNDSSCLYPATYHRWSDRLAVSPDGQEVAVTVQGFRSTSDGGPCIPSSDHCRIDVFTAVFSTANGWCGPDGCTGDTINQEQMFSANFDDTALWVDHLVPATMMFAYRTVANSWFDFRYDPVNDKDYRLGQSYFQLTSTGGVYDYDEALSSQAALWSPGAVADGGSYYGDIDTTAMSPLHAVIAREFSVFGTPNPIGYLWSPDAYLAF